MTGRSMIGEKFGLLTVISEAGRRGRHRLWACQCECGKMTEATTGHLNAGNKTTCGCVKSGWKNKRHGLSHSPEYRAWDNARSRCLNPKTRKYPLYGGRGIEMCSDWVNSFDKFIEDMGMRPGPNHSLDRIDGDGPYSKANCRWATAEVQNNNRSFNRLLEIEGETMTVAQASRLFKVPHATILSRLKAGKSAQEAVRG